MSATEEKARGRGILSVHDNLWPHMGKPETPAAWHKAILLPDEWRVEQVERGQHDFFELTVSHESLPVVDDVHSLSLTMHHRKEYDVVLFDHIEAFRWDGEHWQEVKLHDV